VHSDHEIPGGTRGPDGERTERLLLCRPTPADAEAHFAIHSDPATNVHLPQGRRTDPRSSEAQLREWAQHWQTEGYGYWTVRDLADCSVLGFGGIRPTPGRGYLNLGYRFRPSAWGNGYATEVGLAAVHLAARVAPGLPVVALIQPANTPSIRVAERIGLRLDIAAGLDEQGFARYSNPATHGAAGRE